jgi:hypothetical protein
MINLIKVLKYFEILGLKKPTELEIAEERDARMRSEYLHSIDAFPQRIDQLLEVVNRVCCTFIIQFIFTVICFLLDLYESKIKKSRKYNLIVTDFVLFNLSLIIMDIF